MEQKRTQLSQNLGQKKPKQLTLTKSVSNVTKSDPKKCRILVKVSHFKVKSSKSKFQIQPQLDGVRQHN